MKKLVLGMILFCSVGLSACSKKEDAATAASTKQTTTETTQEKPKVTFKDGTLENDDFKIEYKDTYIINSPQEGEPGLYVTYKFTNKSKEKINPADTLDKYVSLSQQNDTSEIDLDNNYYTWDVFEDDDKLGKMESDGENDLLPGKTVDAAQGYYFDNKDHPVQMQMLVDPEAGEYSDIYKIDLKKVQEIPAPESDEDDSVSANNVQSNNDAATEQPSSNDPQPGNAEREQAAQDEYWAKVNSGMTDEEAAAAIDKENGVPDVDDDEYYYEDDPGVIYNDKEGYVEIDGERTYYDDEDE